MKYNLSIVSIVFILGLFMISHLYGDSQSGRCRPNIIFILVDDMGWKDLSITGSTFYETPNIDHLATSGMRFSNAYAACPVCSPTRAALLTGKYPARLKITNWIDARGTSHPVKAKYIDADYLKQLPLEEKTIAESLHEVGYTTWHIGKWHLGGSGFYPTDQGFDVNVAGCNMGHPWKGYFSPWQIPTLEEGPQGEYLTDRLTDEAIKLIRKNAQLPNAKPFYLNMWYYSVHTPIQAKQDKINYFIERKKKLGLDLLKQNDIFGEEDGSSLIPRYYGQKIKYRKVQNNVQYAAMLSSLDDNIGRIIKVLDELDLRGNTIIIFTSDNGGLSTGGEKPTSNEPLRAGKSWFYEGGIREPLFVVWPSKIKEGSCSPRQVTSTDFYPTILELLGLPTQPKQHIDGISFANALLSVNNKSNNEKQRDLFWHFPHYHPCNTQGPGSAILSGNWKLIELFENNTVQLYNINEDPSEKNDLASKNPEKVSELLEKLRQWRNEVHATMPEKNPN